MCRELFADTDAVQSLFKIDFELAPIAGRSTQHGVLECVYPTAGGQAGTAVPGRRVPRDLLIHRSGRR